MAFMPKLMGEVEGGASPGAGSLVGNTTVCASAWAVDGVAGLVLDVAVDICFGSIFTGGLGRKGTRTGGASSRRVSRSGCSNGIVTSKAATED